MKCRVLLGILIAVSLCLSACDMLPKPDEPKETPIARDEPTAPSTEKADPQEQPTATPTSGGEPQGQTGDFGELRSYRLYARRTDQENGQVSETTTACVLDPFALHTISQGGDGSVEMIAVDNAVWMRFSDQGWYKTEFTPEEMADLENELDLDQELDDLPDIPWPQDLVYLPGQVGLPLEEGGLTQTGAETVNGVHSIRYEVASDYSYLLDMPMVGQVTTTVRATGTIWVADQSGLPRIVMQADVYETETTITPAGTDTSTVHIEHQVTELNTPVTIEPPEGAVEMGSGMPGEDDASAPAADQGDDDAPTITLDDLDSYRLEWSVTIEQEEYETQTIYLFEWIREPPTYRHVVDMMGVTFEHLWAGDKVWMKPAGLDDWIEISADEAPDPLDALSGVLDWDEGMTPDGDETINGIRSRCYITEMAMLPHATGYHRVCIADQAGIPPLVIHGLMQIEQQGSTTITESNLYDINQPFVIETPE